jgi:hypothetical protein
MGCVSGVYGAEMQEKSGSKNARERQCQRIRETSKEVVGRLEVKHDGSNSEA